MQLAHTIVVAPLFQRRLATTRLAVQLRLLRPKALQPLLTPLTRAIGLLASPSDPAERAQTPFTFDAAALPDTARFYGALSHGVRALFGMNKHRLFAAVLRPADQAQAVFESLGLTAGPRAISPELFVDLCTHGAGPGPVATEVVAGRTWLRLAAASDPQVEPQRSSDPIAAAVSSALLTRLLELGIRELDNPARVAEDIAGLSPDGFVQALATTFSTVGLSLAGAYQTALTDVLQHVLAILGHRWVRAALPGSGAVRLQQMVELLQQQDYSVPGWEGWPECEDETLWDAATFGPSLRALAKERLLSMSEANPGPGYALAAELAPLPALDEAVAAGLMQMATVLHGYVERARLLYLEVQGSDTTVGSAGLNLDLPAFKDSLNVALRPHRVEGYPLWTPFEPRAVLPAQDDALLLAGASRWEYHTLGGLRAVTRHNIRSLCVEVLGTAAEELTGQTFPTLLPVIEQLHTLTPAFTQDAGGLARAWSMTERELSKVLRTAGPSTSSVMLKAAAHALRFVGLIALRRSKEGGATVYEPITPPSGLVYHATGTAWRATVANYAAGASDHPFLTPAIPMTEWLEAGVDLVLLPFNSIPSSADYTGLRSAIAEVDPYAVLPSESVFRWAHTDSMLIQRSAVALLGWRSSRPDVAAADYILLSPECAFDGDVLVLAGQTEHRPSFLHRPNAIVSLVDPGADQVATARDVLTVPQSVGAEGPLRK